MQDLRRSLMYEHVPQQTRHQKLNTMPKVKEFWFEDFNT